VRSLTGRHQGSDRLPSDPEPHGQPTSAGRSLINSSSVTKLRLPLDCPVPGGPQRPTRPQASGQLTAQRSAALHIERLIDRLMRHGALTHHRGSQRVADQPNLSPGSKHFCPSDVLLRLLTVRLPGHWEGDLILVSTGQRSALWSSAQAGSRCCCISADRRSQHPQNEDRPADHGCRGRRRSYAIADTIGTLPEQLRRSLTWTRGSRWPSTSNSGSTPVCRSTSAIHEAVAARHKREHQRAAAPVFP